jgi:hypothetical protein
MNYWMAPVHSWKCENFESNIKNTFTLLVSTNSVTQIATRISCLFVNKNKNTILIYGSENSSSANSANLVIFYKNSPKICAKY